MEAKLQRGAGLSFQFDPEARALIATVTPDAGSSPIDEAWLRDELAARGHAELRYLTAAATQLLASYNRGSPITVRLAECVDAVARIAISKDGLEACLDLEAAQGGAPITRAQLLGLLAEHGIGDGVLDEALDAAVAAGFARNLVVARGRAPVHGRDGRLESLLPEARSRVPKVDESGHTDYRDLGEILVVQPGDPLMLRHLPTEGIPGITLLGETIPAVPGKDVMFAARLEGTALAPDNPNLLVAAIAGQPVAVRGGMMVEPLYKIDEVGTASGNIDFDGSVSIRGDVGAGMTVRATGDIEIGGVAELATLEAGGSIVIKGGAIGGLGRNSDNGGHVRCGGSFTAAYAQQVDIQAGDSIFIDDVAMQCRLSAINHVRVGNKRRGHIIGGSVQATLSITAKVIGSPNRIRTLLEIGVNPLMQKHLLELAQDRDAKETQLLEVSKLFGIAKKQPGKIPPQMLDKARATAASLSESIAALRDEQDLLTKKIEIALQARVTAEQAIYDGAEIRMGTQRHTVVGEHAACAICLNGNRLELVPI